MKRLLLIAAALATPVLAQTPAGHDHAAMLAAQSAAKVAESLPPPPPAEFYADRFYDPAEMAKARAYVHYEHGGMPNNMMLFNLAEYHFNDGAPGIRWDGEFWTGSDWNRFVLSTEGETARRSGVEDAEVQAMWGHAIDPYFDLRAGVRQDFRPRPGRTYATVGFEGVAPYWFDIEGFAYLSDKGKVSARFKVDYDQRVTQRLIVQPRIELNFAASDDQARDIGAGLSDFELGLRARYELRREFAPYVGISWTRKTGDTADFARAAGEKAGETSLVAGIRFWF